MSIETGGYSPERHEEGAIQEFIESISLPETSDLLPKIEAKIKKSNDVLGEIRKLDKNIADTDGEPEDIVKVLKTYLGQKPKNEGVEEDLGEEDEDIDEEEGFGSDEEEF